MQGLLNDQTSYLSPAGLVLLANQMTRGISPIIVNEISIHQPLLPVSCNLRHADASVGKRKTKFTINDKISFIGSPTPNIDDPTIVAPQLINNTNK